MIPWPQHRCLCVRIRLLASLLIPILLLSCHNSAPHLEEIRKLNYPSASGIEYFGKQVYIIGDDATHLLILDSLLNITDSIQLYTSGERRIPKDRKADLEAITLIRYHDSLQLMLLGSGSLVPWRNTAWLINPSSKRYTEWRLDTFFRRLKFQLPELNIEGAGFIGGSVVLSARGHKGFPKNYLVFTSPDFFSDQSNCPINLVKIGANEDTANFQGVSGMAYSRNSDTLILTVSTENTRSTYEDGTIGKSYLWIVDNISSKRRWKAINPNQVIDLESGDTRFKGQKLESVCILEETRKFFQLALVADNDDGSSMLFKVYVEKE